MLRGNINITVADLEAELKCPCCVGPLTTTQKAVSESSRILDGVCVPCNVTYTIILHKR